MSARTTRGRRPAPTGRPGQDLPAVAQAAPQGPPQVEPRPSPRGPSSGAALAQAPDEPGQDLPNLGELLGGHLREVLVAKHLGGAVGERRPQHGRRRGPAGGFRPLRLFLAAPGRRVEPRLAEAAPLAQGPEVEGGHALGGLAPEGLEGFVEQRNVLAPPHDEGPHRVVHVALASQLDEAEGGGEVDHPRRAAVQAQAVEDPPEEQQVGEELAAGGVRVRTLPSPRHRS